MHRTSSRALRAVAWTALASTPFISTAAAAAGDMFLKLKLIKESVATGSTGGQIEVQSFSWGATRTSARAAKMDDLGIKQPVATDIDGDGRRGAAAAAGAKPSRAAATAEPSDKLAQVRGLATGSLTVAAALPGCAVGTRYLGAELGTPAGRYELEDVVIASCATESVTLNYAKMTASGEDPDVKR